MDEPGFKASGEVFFSKLPPGLRQVVPHLARRSIKKQLYGHGIGRHSRDEIYALGCRDVVALADILGEQDYLMGAQPSAVDATGYAFLATLLWVPVASPLKEAAQKYANLEAYCQRMKARYFSSTPART